MDFLEYNLAILIPLMKENNIPITIDNIEEIHKSGEDSMNNGLYCDEYGIIELWSFLYK
jgi:hypothetical protein